MPVRSTKSELNFHSDKSHPMYSELKKQHSVTITETGWKSLKAIAAEHGVSVSELFEQIGRKKLRISNH